MIENSAGWRYVQSADTVADYPTVSEHNAAKFQELKSNVAGKAPLTHTHSTSQVTGLDAALDGKAPVSHTHPQSQVTGLDTALQGKAPVSHTHSTSQVTGLDAALDGKAPVSHTHTQSQVTGLDTALAGKAPLTTLNTRVPENLALRLDTTVGTRIFAGDTMIHGDTGYVNLIPSDRWTVSLTSSRLAITRVGNIVEIEGRISPAGLTVGSARTGLSSIAEIPLGFRPRNAPGGGSRHSAGQAYLLVGAGVGETGTLLFTEGQGLSIRMASPTTNVWASTDYVLVHAVWRTTDPWPISIT